MEHAEQVNRLGLERLMDEYVRVCAANKWSEKSAKKQLAAVKDPQDLAKAAVELGAVVDAGTPLVSNTYTCESKQPMVFVAAEIVAELNNLYGGGVEQFPKFAELDKKAGVAADIMAKEMVRLFCSLSFFPASLTMQMFPSHRRHR